MELDLPFHKKWILSKILTIKREIVQWRIELCEEINKAWYEPDFSHPQTRQEPSSLVPLKLLIEQKNPQTHILRPPGKRDYSISHLFFVYVLKTYAQDSQEAKLQFDLITTFIKDINMQFGGDKCA